MAFAHLHVHSRYSVCDGVADIYALFKRARNLRQAGLALTDHGALYGVPEFLETAQRFPDIKPVVGCEIWLTDHYDHKIKDIFHRKCFHLTLLAKNLAGYRNLVRIVTLGKIEGEFYAKPRISHEVLAEHKEGLIALSGCIAGEIPQAVLHDDLDKAEAAIEWHREVFGDDFYLEVMSHKWSKSGKGHNLKEMQDKVNAVIFDLAGKYSVDVVATNDVHFVLKKDALLQDVMFEEYIYKDLHKGEKYSPLYTGEEYIKSEKQMLALFTDHPEAVSNTMKVLEKIERYSIVSPPELPDYPVPDGYSQDGFLHRLCTDALDRKGCNDTAHRSRLEYELKATEERGYANWFLILWDLVRSVREKGGLVVSGCGDIASSLINYLLDTAELDPVQFGLAERFINNSERQYPDLELFFDKTGSQIILPYLREKYGHMHIAKVVALVHPIPKEAEEIAERYKLSRKSLNYAFDITNLNYSKSECKGTVLLSRKPMSEYVPLSLSSTDNGIVSAYDNKYYGLRRFTAGPVDFEFLTSDALDLIRKITRECGINYRDIPLDDKKTYELFSEGRTEDIFFFDSQTARISLKSLSPDSFLRLALCSICERESFSRLTLFNHDNPVDLFLFPDEESVKSHNENNRCVLTGISDILDETSGIVVYMEQLMLIGQRVAGFSPEESERLRTVVDYKRADEYPEIEAMFIKGGCKKGYGKNDLKNFLSEIYNRKHLNLIYNRHNTLRHTYLAYLCGYLKAHFPETYQKHRRKYNKELTEHFCKL